MEWNRCFGKTVEKEEDEGMTMGEMILCRDVMMWFTGLVNLSNRICWGLVINNVRMQFEQNPQPNGLS